MTRRNATAYCYKKNKSKIHNAHSKKLSFDKKHSDRYLHPMRSCCEEKVGPWFVSLAEKVGRWQGKGASIEELLLEIYKEKALHLWEQDGRFQKVLFWEKLAVLSEKKLHCSAERLKGMKNEKIFEVMFRKVGLFERKTVVLREGVMLQGSS